MTEQYRYECEVREWAKRYKEKRSLEGLEKAKTWINGHFEYMTKHRGKEAVQRLKNDIRECLKNERK